MKDMWKQIKDFTKKLSKFQKIAFGVVAGIIVVGMLVIFLSSSETQYAVMYNNLAPGDAAKIVEKLKENQVEYELQDQGATILVEKDKVYDTRLSLASAGLPEESNVGYEIFDKTNLGVSEFVQKVNYRRALEGELARTIGTLEEVRKVRVHIVIPDRTLFEKDQKPTTASVTLHLKSGKSLSKISVDGIQNLISNSVEGMQPQHVTVLDQRGKVLSEAPLDESSLAGMTSTQHEQQRKVEEYLSQKVQSLLDGALGTDNSKVRVNVELDFTSIEKTVTDFDPETQVVRSEQSINSSSGTEDTVSNPSVRMRQDQSNQISNYEISKSVEHIIKGIGNVKRLTASVLINGTTKVMEDEQGKRLEYVPRNQEEMNKLNEIVKNALGYDPTRNDQISVLNVPFDTMLEQIELEKFYEVPWWKNPDNQKLILLLMAMLVTILLMYILLQSKYVKERLRIAFNLPESVEVEEEEETEEEEEVEELELDEEELLLLPAELPEQLLLESERIEEEFEEQLDAVAESTFDKESLAERAKAKLEEESPEMTEERIMKLEIKNKVQSYLDDQTDDAVRLIRMFIAQDMSARNFF